MDRPLEHLETIKLFLNGYSPYVAHSTIYRKRHHNELDKEETITESDKLIIKIYNFLCIGNFPIDKPEFSNFISNLKYLIRSWFKSLEDKEKFKKWMNLNDKFFDFYTKDDFKFGCSQDKGDDFSVFSGDKDGDYKRVDPNHYDSIKDTSDISKKINNSLNYCLGFFTDDSDLESLMKSPLQYDIFFNEGLKMRAYKNRAPRSDSGNAGGIPSGNVSGWGLSLYNKLPSFGFFPTSPAEKLPNAAVTQSPTAATAATQHFDINAVD